MTSGVVAVVVVAVVAVTVVVVMDDAGSAHGSAATVLMLTVGVVPLAHVQRRFRTDRFRHDLDLHVGIVMGTVPVGGVLHVIDLCSAFALTDLAAQGGIVPDRRAATTDRLFEGDLLILPELVELERTPGCRYFPGQIAGPNRIPSGRKIRLRRPPLLRATVTDRVRLLPNEGAFRRGHAAATAATTPTGRTGGGGGQLWCVVRRLSTFHREVFFLRIGRVVLAGVVIQIARIARGGADVVHSHFLPDLIVAIG